jgi:hypothetical protein
MNANQFGEVLTRFLGRGCGQGKIKANSSSVLQIANRCGAVAELAAGTYTIPTLTDSGQDFFYFWVKASGTLTITGAGSMVANDVALIVLDASNGWSMMNVNATSQATGINIADVAEKTPATNVETAFAQLFGRLPAKKTANATTTTVTPAAGALTGANHVFYQNNADGALTVTTRTAEELTNDDTFIYAGYKYLLTIVNTGDNTVTLVGGTGVTLGAGTNTVATATTRTYLVEVVGIAGAGEMTITSINKGTLEAT